MKDLSFQSQKFSKPHLFCLFVFLVSLSCEPENPGNQPEIPEGGPEERPEEIIEIPDAYFKHLLINTNSIDTDANEEGDADIDLNNDGEIQISEANKIKGLILPIDYSEINRPVDFTGINNFRNLNQLIISAPNYVGIEPNRDSVKISYDFSGLLQLEKLRINYLNSSYIEEIDLSGLDKLKTANLDGVKPQFFEGDYDIPFNFTKMNFDGCVALKELSLINSWLIIDYCEIPNLKKLNLFYLEGGEPDTFDLHCLTQLEWLDISENYFEGLILKNNSVLTYFRAKDIGSGYYDTNTHTNYPFLKYICIDDIEEEWEQISTLVDENTTVSTNCEF